MILGVDTGGTFTDFVLLDQQQIRIHKVLSSPHAPEQAIIQGIQELGLEPYLKQGQLRVIHGSTVATNAALERKGVRTAYIANQGLADILTLGRQARQELYSLTPSAPPQPVPSELCLAINVRRGPKAEVIAQLKDSDIQQLLQQLEQLQPEATAINLLFSYLDHSDEQQLKQALQQGLSFDCFISCSHEVLPEYKEYERGIATWLNAWLGPVVEGYISRLSEFLSGNSLSVMQSSGGTISAQQAAKRAVNLLLSGPAGGLNAALFMAQKAGIKQLMTFDMGGTSTDVALLKQGIQLSTESKIGPYPVAVPMVDMETIGAGGGSIAYLDSGGALQLGPESAGANPGPACYGQGGLQATVTDANALLGRLRPQALLAGKMALDINASHQVLSALGEQLNSTSEATALGIIALANEHMTQALRQISIQQGFDPQDFCLSCFGGAGGLHLCELAENLNINRAMVPLYGGVLSAFGMLVAPAEHQASRSLQVASDNISQAQLKQILLELKQQGEQVLLDDGYQSLQLQHQASLDLRYQGQAYALNIAQDELEPALVAFEQEHQQRYGHKLEQAIELVTVRLATSADANDIDLTPAKATEFKALEYADLAGIGQQVPVYNRDSLPIEQLVDGPMLITEQVSTTLVKPGWQVKRDKLGNLQLNKS